mgnify:CR=1 FL=1
MKKYKENDLKEGISLGLIEKHLRRLRISVDLSDNEVFQMFNDIHKYLQDTDAVNKFVYLITSCSREGIICIA